MKIIDITDIPGYSNETKTIEHLGKALGTRVNILQQVVTLRKDLTFSLLTDGLKRVFVQDPKASSAFQQSDALTFEWTIESTNIPRIRIVEDCTSTGIGKTPITLILERNYYSQGDTFALENLQQLFVIQPVEKLADNRFRYICTLVGSDLSKAVDTRFTTRNKTTQYRSNYAPELSDRGFTKYMINIEKHRGHISRHRVGDSWSSDAAVIYFQITGKNNKPEYYQMPKPEKNLLENFLVTRESNMLFGRTNFDINNKCMDQDAQGRDIPMGDGVIAQVERYCDKFSYSTLTTSLFDDALDSVIRKTGKGLDNHITVVCNHIGYKQAMRAMEDKLRQYAVNGAFYYTKEKDKVDVGAHYRQYLYNGNTITFTIDTALSEIYTEFGYLIFIDTAVNDGRPNIVKFTLKGREMIEGTLHGMGGFNGMTSGNIASAIDGTEKHILGYSGVAVFNPYAAFIMKENIG